MRWIGALAVMLACMGMSLSLIRALRGELLCLKSLCHALERMRAELATTLCPLPRLLEEAARVSEGEAASFFCAVSEGMESLSERSFAEIWTDAAGRCLPSLQTQERAELEQLGAALGRYELQEQLAAIDRFLLSASDTLSRRRLQFPDRRRLILALGTAAGGFLCLLML